MADHAGPSSFNGADLLIRNEAQVRSPLFVQRAKSKIKNRDQPIPAIIVVAPNGKEMTADTSEGHPFRLFVILLPSTLGAPA
jgi:hypothetical protein